MVYSVLLIIISIVENRKDIYVWISKKTIIFYSVNQILLFI